MKMTLIPYSSSQMIIFLQGNMTRDHYCMSQNDPGNYSKGVIILTPDIYLYVRLMRTYIHLKVLCCASSMPK